MENKIVLITGASSGIGLATAKRFAKAGAHLLLCARRLDVIEALSQELHETYNVTVHPFQLDVTNPIAVQEEIENLPLPWQKIDILINNAGLAAGLDLFQDAAIDDWEAMINTNVKGLLYVTKAVLPQMIERHSGHIINIGSIAGHGVYPKGSVYCASKHAVKALTEGLRMDLLGTGIRVSTIDPGAVKTNFSLVRFKGDQERADAVYKGREPLSSEDIAEAIYYCASRPAHINIAEMVILPADQASATMTATKA